MADGSIRISTKLDTTETKVDLKQVEKECEKTAKRIEDVGKKIKTAFTGETGMDKLADDCGKTAAKLEQVGQTAQAVYTDMSKTQLNSAFKTANKELEKTQAELTEIQNKIAAIQAETDTMLPQAASDEQTAALLDMEERETQELLAQRDQLTMKAEEYKAQLQAITAELEKQTAEQREQAAISAGGKDLSVAKKDQDFLSGIKGQEEYNATLSSISARMAMIEQQADRIAAKHGVSRDKLLQQDTEYQQLARRQELLIKNQDRYQREVEQSTRATKKLGDAGATAGNKASKGLDKASKSSKRMNSNLKNGIKTLGKMALACLAVEGAFTAVRRATTAYLEDNQKLQNQLTSIWSVLGQAIGPVMEWFIQGISTIIVWVNSLVKSLSGIDLIARANAAALKKQEKATKDAAKAAQLAGFDEMTKLSDNTASGSGSDTGPALFDTSMAGDIPDFFEEIKKKLLAGDFFGAGETLGDTLIKWIEDTDWVDVGNTLGEFLGNAVGFALGFALQLDPFTIQDSVSGLIGGLFKGLADQMQKWDWNKIGRNLLKFILFGFMAADPALTILTILLSPNGDDLASGASKLIGSIIGGLLQAAVGLFQEIGAVGKKIWDSIVGWFDENVDWGGTPGEIIDDLLAGIGNALSDIGTWIETNIFEPFAEGVITAFGLEKEEGDTRSWGQMLVDGFLNGIKDGLTNIGKWINDNIWVPFSTWFCDVFGIHSPSDKTQVFGENTIDGFLNGITTAFANIGKWINDNIWVPFKKGFCKIFGINSGESEEMEEFGGDISDGLTSGIGDIWGKVKKKFEEFKKNIGTWAEGVKNTFKDPINSLIGIIEKAVNWIISKLNTLSWDVPEWVPFIGGNTWGFNIKPISIPRLAKGAIVNNPGRGVPVIAGEAGKEAVLPLENNTEWMDELADKINAGVQKIVVPIYLNGRKIAEEIIDLNNKRRFATNGV